MKPAPIRIPSDVAVGLKGSLAKLAGLSNLEVAASGSTINVKARISEGSLSGVQDVINDYKDSGFSIVLDRRVS
jgi:hypothetical protein